MKPTHLVLLVLAGCGGSTASTLPAAAVPATEAPPTAQGASSAALDLALRTANGAFIDIADYRGTPVLIALLGSYDTMSQASLDSLTRISHAHRDMLVVGVLVQQGAELLVDAYVAGAHVDFPITWDPSGDLLEGRTPLGPLEQIPLFVALDAEGRIAATVSGYVSAGRLDEMLATAYAAAPIRRAAPPPLLGRPR